MIDEFKRLKEYYPDYLTNTYFFPLILQSIDLKIPADILSKYYFSKSINRIASPTTEFFHDNDNIIASTIVNAYKKKWEQALKVIELDYAPADNYNMVEEGTDNTITSENNTIDNNSNETNTNTINNTTTSTGSDTTTYGKVDDNNNTTTYGKKEDIDENRTTEGTNNKYGINSNTAHADNNYTSTDTDNMTTTTSGIDTVTNKNTSSGSDKIDRTISNTSENSEKGEKTNTNKITEDKSGSNNVIHHLTRKGNIGVTTTQQMIESDIELWKWIFINDVVTDINKILTLSIY